MRSTKTIRETLLASGIAVLLTVFHHVYGGVIYSTPWRYHVAAVALPVMLVLILAYYVHRRDSQTWFGRTALWFFLVLTLLFPVAGIGLFEGGYNHLMKDALYFAGAPRILFDKLFPAPLYEMPDDVLFEVTGVLQFFIGLYTGYCLFTWWPQIRGKKIPGNLGMREVPPWLRKLPSSRARSRISFPSSSGADKKIGARQLFPKLKS